MNTSVPSSRLSPGWYFSDNCCSLWLVFWWSMFLVVFLFFTFNITSLSTWSSQSVPRISLMVSSTFVFVTTVRCTTCLPNSARLLYRTTAAQPQKPNVIKMDTLPNWYSNLSLTDTSVAAVVASGFLYSVHPCLRIFLETPTMHVAAPTMPHASCCHLNNYSLRGKMVCDSVRPLLAFHSTILVLQRWRTSWSCYAVRRTRAENAEGAEVFIRTSDGEGRWWS